MSVVVILSSPQKTFGDDAGLLKTVGQGFVVFAQ